jgi:hypothetical protein
MAHRGPSGLPLPTKKRNNPNDFHLKVAKARSEFRTWLAGVFVSFSFDSGYRTYRAETAAEVWGPSTLSRGWPKSTNLDFQIHLADPTRSQGGFKNRDWSIWFYVEGW